MSDTVRAIHPALRTRHRLNDQARQILDRRLCAVLGTENEDRTVHLAPVMFLLDGPRRLNERIRTKYLTDRGQRACGDFLGELDDITIVVTPTRWLSWDMNALLENIAAQGADLDEIDDWFRAVI